MSLEYKIGDSLHPKGHAIVYFIDTVDSNKVSASYIILLPITVDISKYVPPFLSNQVDNLSSKDMSSFSFPPAPEIVDSEDWIRETAKKRDDDLIFGGFHNLSDVTNLMNEVAKILDVYSESYDKNHQNDEKNITGNQLDDVNDVVYSMMSEADLLSELTIIICRFQYQVSGNDKDGIKESEAKILSIGKQLPENRNVDLLIKVCKNPGEKYINLARLYLDRIYAMYREEYEKIKLLEKEIIAAEKDLRLS